MCIFKLRLETEKPEIARHYAEKFHGFRMYPVKLNKENIDEYFKNNDRYEELLKYPDSKLDENDEVYVRYLTDEEKQFLCSTIEKGFYESVSDSYQRNNFSVEVVDSCDAAWGNGKIFYVFPTAYDSYPILNF